MTKIEEARKIYAEKGGVKRECIDALMQLGYSRQAATTYWQNAKNEAILEPRQQSVRAHLRELDSSPPTPARRTVTLSLSMDLEDMEDDYEIAQIALRILNEQLCNNFQLKGIKSKS